MANKKNLNGNDRMYSFSCVTYVSADEVHRILRQHDIKTAWMMEHNDEVYDEGEKKGQPKEPHTHFVFRTKNGHTFDAIRKWFDGVKDPTSGLQVNVRIEQTKGSTERGAVRYLAHLDNPEKKQYNPEDILCFNAESRRQLADFQADDGAEGRQYEVIMLYANYEINLREAMKLAPELFIHKYASVCALVRDLREEIHLEFEWNLNEREYLEKKKEEDAKREQLKKEEAEKAKAKKEEE